MPKKILFIGPHRPTRVGSQRFRMEQFFPFYEKAGFQCDYSWFIDANDDKVFYGQGNLVGKLLVMLKAARVRLGDVLRANNYDIIYIQREAFMLGTTIFERLLTRSKAKVIFDFDDAIWEDDVSVNNAKLRWLKRPLKADEIMAMSDWIVVGNQYLADHALQFNQHVTIVPTVVDTDVYLPVDHTRTPVCVGWSGSKTTVKHFEPIVPVLKRLKAKYGDKIYFKQIGDKNFKAEDIEVDSSDWQYDTEISELNKIDIGLMPLPDDKWAKGKCGFKAIQYMALEIPPIVSPVGVNTVIVQHGENGFVANTEDDWVKCISTLIESDTLRKKMGTAARKTVVANYSVKSQVGVLTGLFNSLIEHK